MSEIPEMGALMLDSVLQINQKRIVVLGGAGFIGSALVRRLINQQHAVYVVDNFFHGSRQNLAGIPQLDLVTDLDALDYRSLRDYMIRLAPDIVVNCIGDTFIPSAYDMPERVVNLNVRTTLNVLRASTEAKTKRVLHLSSTDVYGDNAAQGCNELTPLAPENTCAVSTMAADRLCYTFALEHGLPTVIARLSNAYGPRETHPYIVPEIIGQLSVSSYLSLGNLEAKRDFTYVDDIVAALDSLLWIPAQRGEVFNVGSGDAVSVGALARLLGVLMGQDSITISVNHSRLRKRDPPRLCCDSTKLRSRTGWAPRVSIEQGLKMTVDWFKSNDSRWPWQEQLQDSFGEETWQGSYKSRIAQPT
jgi:nucleoside-diphosphate-sugar epimerase